MSTADKKAKRVKAFNKLNNQIGILSRTATKKDQSIVAQIQELAATLSLAK